MTVITERSGLLEMTRESIREAVRQYVVAHDLRYGSTTKYGRAGGIYHKGFPVNVDDLVGDFTEREFVQALAYARGRRLAIRNPVLGINIPIKT